MKFCVPFQSCEDSEFLFLEQTLAWAPFLFLYFFQNVAICQVMQNKVFEGRDEYDWD